MKSTKAVFHEVASYTPVADVPLEYWHTPNAYRMGQWKDIKTAEFDITKAAKGYKETTIQRMAEEDRDIPRKDWETGFFGISQQSRQWFAVNPTAKHWRTTVLHEIGHLFVNVEPNSLYALLNPNAEMEDEIEAILFSYFMLKKLGIPEFESIGHSMNEYIKAGWGQERAFPAERIEYVKKKADEFYELGRMK